MVFNLKRYKSASSITLYIVCCIFTHTLVYGAAKNADLSFDSFVQENGLPNNQIQCIYQDKTGWMWIGTSQGLSRFDGYNFTNFSTNPKDTTSLHGNLVRVITEDKKGNLWIGTENGGLNLFDREKEQFSRPYKNHPEFKFREISINAITLDKQGTIYLGTSVNIMKIDTVGNLTAITPTFKNEETLFSPQYIRKIQFDKQGDLWIGANTGLFKYSPENNTIESIDLPFGKNHNKEIWEIYLDEEGLIWVGTYSVGLFIINPIQHSFEAIELAPKVNRSETVRSISTSVFGEYWIGTRGGLYSYNKKKGITGFYRHDERKPRSLTNTSVLSVFHDNNGETWIGTRGGLNLLARSKQVFHNFTSLPGDNNYLNSSTIYTFWIDKEDKIWIGTEDGGINIYDPKTGTYTYLVANKNDTNSISQNCIKAFQYDGKGNLWVATFLGGIDIINLRTGKIMHYKNNPDKRSSLSDNRVWDICMDNEGTIWVGTSKGLDCYQGNTDDFKHYDKVSEGDMISWIDTDSKGNIWLGSPSEVIVFNKNKYTVKRFPEHSRSIYEDSKKNIWVATIDQGIALYSSSTGPIQYFNEQDGLANNQALCILEDDKNNLWISTTNGISKFNVEDKTFQNFTSNDGLGNNQFCYGASYKTKNGEMLFGSISGFNMFKPNDVESLERNSPIIFTDLKIFNKSVPIGTDKKSVLKKSITETKHLTLSYNQNVFTLEFATLNFVNSDKNQYTYILDGFNKSWNAPSKIRSATYTNLNPGNYTLKIKRAGYGYENDSNILALKITISPPFWKTKLFLSFLLVLIISLIYILVRFIITREKIKNQLVLERVNSRKLHEIDMMKLKFFTNISHEIRTPLTLILGPLEKLMDKKPMQEDIKENLQLMHRNAKNLDRLMSQLLDFRKLQTGNLKLSLTQDDIVDFVRNVVYSFNDFAQEKEIQLRFNTLKKSLNAAFDPDKIEKIINNLISNAFKFTDSGGKITVNLSLVFDSNDNDFEDSDKEQQFIEISVKDTGKGIPVNNLNRIFHRFFQTEDEPSNSGVGIGLALVKDLVDIHNGKIYVTSKPGKGTKFMFRIPYSSTLAVKNKAKKTDQASLGLEDASQSQALKIDATENPNSKIMLIVEDNADVRSFISSHFKSEYKVIEAKNGAEGFKTALEAIPDIIISDVLMPGIDGYELCKRIKDDERTSHIPVILLTALHSKEHKIKGLATGADDYITKPFDLGLLHAKINNLLSIRNTLKEKFVNTVVLEPTNVILTSPDELFLQRAIKVVEENISDSDLDIESFALKVGISRMQLYRKLNALTNMTVKEFIRHIRLKRATQLLAQKKMNVSEVAYSVGFKDLSHFRKCFKREYGMSASQYIAKTNPPSK